MPGQLETHPLRGALFETWVAAEIAKAHLHRGRRPRLSFYRDRGGLEIDLVVERGADLLLVEVKSAQTPSAQALASFERFEDVLAGKQVPRIAIDLGIACAIGIFWTLLATIFFALPAMAAAKPKVWSGR